RTSLSAVMGPDGKIYVLGGQSVIGTVGSIEIFDPNTDSWSSLASQLPAIQAAVLGPDRRVYVIGGTASGTTATSLNSLKSFDPANPSSPWTSLPAMPTPRVYFGLTLGADGRIYTFGGLNASNQGVNTVEAFDPRTATWSSLASMPTARLALGAALDSDGALY